MVENDPDASRGIYEKYEVRRKHDAEGKHRECFYWVLDTSHDKFAAQALRAYARACKREYPKLAAELLVLVSRMGGKPPKKPGDVLVNGIRLIDRERRLLQYAADERSDEDMARQLNCSVASILRLKLSIMRKFKMDSLRAVVLEAIRAGVVKPQALPRPRHPRGSTREVYEK